MNYFYVNETWEFGGESSQYRAGLDRWGWEAALSETQGGLVHLLSFV